ncbi:MAG: homoserine dehydrogenase [Clostridia bacterium]|nr:homoserine dehydrogenase [Clostridia bacterium]
MKIAVLGYGTVGKGVEVLAGKSESIEVKRILVRKGKTVKENMTDDFQDILNDPEIELVVECMGGIDPAGEYVLSALKKGKHVVTSNKMMAASIYPELLKASEEGNAELRFSSSCGGGIPWLPNLKRYTLQDDVKKIYGIMNGTSNYILDSIFTKNMGFSDALKIAQDKGYAEADPTNDICGYDTGYKTVLSGNVAFNGCFNPKDMLVLGIKNISDEEIGYCRENGLRIVLKGEAVKTDDKVSLAVYPQYIDSSSALSNVSVNNNCFVLESENLGTLSFKGQGAGMLPTASNVILDIMDIMAGNRVKTEGVLLTENHDELLSGKFYVRGNDISVFDDVCEMRTGTYIITKELSVKELREKVKGMSPDAFVARID